MSRSLYFVGGLAAMLLIALAQGFAVAPQPPADAGATARATPTTDPTAAAIDDLAAWPAAAGR